ncbi:DUF4019 domain-containing protein [Tahibacter amnicola]|uniref:DUF4019 domain-containing protein n=1 Tax=Tahibacter amnicola TaxID=2976241 RepID=A0ABY6BD52_9GAMM|nr:DUF4019 domain-containing protein [Tahibacter amnicola]UXI67755.1 DUF4019 domain-containing protein [Tahibacter amnicola]
MRRTAAFLLIAALSAGAAAAEPIAEATMPQMKIAQQWLEKLDAGDYATAWRDADEKLRKKADMEKWKSGILRSRQSAQAINCRRALDFELLPDGDGINGLFLTEFEDGHSASERVTVVDDAQGIARVSGYRVGPPLSDRGPACAGK